MDQFHYQSYAQEVIFGPGCLARLGEVAERSGWQRLLLCSNHSMRAGGQVGSVESMLGERLVAVFDRVQPHVQDFQVNQVLALAVEKNVDAVIGMGGGSPIGMAKAIAFALDEKVTLPGGQPLIPVIAIPGTYAGSEMTPVFGVTHNDESPARKVTVNDPRIAPKLVLYDPRLSLALPAEMTAASGINALAHCIEALYSQTRNPLSTAAATGAAGHIFNALYRCYEDGNNLEARSEMLLGAHLAGLALASVTMGLHHGLCHVLGGAANIPHAIANGIILPHVIRFNADVCAPQLLPVAEALGLSINGYSPQAVIEAASQKIYELVGRMKLPQRLRDAGVSLRESDLPQLARLGFQNRAVQNNPKPITDAIQIERLLSDAW